MRYNTNTTQILSGTSFSAPIVAAIASRYGNETTRPIERESFIKTYAQYTGYSDAQFLPVYAAKWNASTANVLKRHVVASVWSPQNQSNIQILNDGSYQGVWNSMGKSASIIVDLGQTRIVKTIRLTPRSSVITKQDGEYKIDFSVASNSTSNSVSPSSAYQLFSTPKHYDRAPITINLNTPIVSRYLIINGTNYGSWLAYSEIEVYGN